MAYNLQAIYDETRKWYTIIPPVLAPCSFFINAPFGRFTPKNNNIFLVDGIKAWIVMEIISPLTFIFTYLRSPLSKSSFGSPPPISLSSPSSVIASLFLVHYLNRALVSPLRTPSRSKSHVLINIFGAFFNVINGGLIGAYLSSPTAIEFLSMCYKRPTFWLGVLVWGAGFFGNIAHDEILLNIRRKAGAKGKAKDTVDKKTHKEYYGIPHGLLYTYISYPNYFCEWVEWLGFAIASSPVPDVSSFPAFLASVSPPYIFLLSEVFLMTPRAFNGHKWYRSQFPDYPKTRRAVIPFIF